jgi:hypothetical protein
MGIFRAVAGVIVGYIAMVIGVFVTLSLAWWVLKADGAFLAAPSWEPSTTWTVTSLVLGLIVAIIGGFVCVLIAVRGSKAPIALAILIVVMGAVSAGMQLVKPDGEEPPPRTAQITMFEAMQYTQAPMLSLIGNPIVGAVGALLGARLRGGKDQQAG